MSTVVHQHGVSKLPLAAGAHAFACPQSGQRRLGSGACGSGSMRDSVSGEQPVQEPLAVAHAVAMIAIDPYGGAVVRVARRSNRGACRRRPTIPTRCARDRRATSMARVPRSRRALRLGRSQTGRGASGSVASPSAALPLPMRRSRAPDDDRHAARGDQRILTEARAQAIDERHLDAIDDRRRAGVRGCVLRAARFPRCAGSIASTGAGSVTRDRRSRKHAHEMRRHARRRAERERHFGGGQPALRAGRARGSARA